MDYYLNLDALQKQFYIESMQYNIKLKVKYDKSKLDYIFGEGKK
ncbi:hypothetical protein CLM_1669 [Clostridium botulinum A2 str. Kyoto]|uniref:Uncharacterized protein n=1 Tax=Clostridium botulinum (strain Kyoto / Type A2) TaxID=536232 RepID=C1FMC4_CLOBJ|nr:hypothetical protein CLM_1669 [Clostridium botulinum A2 str. Kyoto]